MKKLTNKGFSVVEGLLLVIFLTLIGGVGYYVYNQAQKQDETSKPQSSANDNQQKSSDAGWLNADNLRTYTNNQLGFSFKYPKLVAGYSCKKEPDSYRPGTGTAELSVYEGSNTFYVANKKYIKLSDASDGDNNARVFASCDVLDTNLAAIKTSTYIDNIPVTVGVVSREADILPFINKAFDESHIRFEGVTKSKKGDWYDVDLRCIPQTGESECFGGDNLGLNQRLTIRWYKEKKRVVVIEMGQYIHFKDPNNPDDVKNDGETVIEETFRIL